MTASRDDAICQADWIRRLLALPEVFPHSCGDSAHIETHISHLLLLGEFAYKIKKPVNLGFLDFSSLEKRRYCCEEELRLNRRQAPTLYLAVVPIYGTAESPSLVDEGPVLEYAVKMRRFDQENLLNHQLPQKQEILQLADQVARFHLQAPKADQASGFGTLESVYQPMEENFQLIRQQHHPLLQHERLEPLQSWSEEFMRTTEELLQERRESGHIRECHGDLHLGNITRYESHLVPFDGIEFNPGLRWIDTLSDLAFLLMDLQDHKRDGQADLLLNRYLETTGDYAGLPLLRFYLLYRAMVRAKVSAIRFTQPDLEAEESNAVLDEYRSYLSLAESMVRHTPGVLLITHGVSGSGKSYISEWFSEQLMAIRIRSDVERKRLFPDNTPDRYTVKATATTYAHLLGMAKRLLGASFSVVVDAAFLKQSQRQMFVELARELSTPLLILDCNAPDELLKARVGKRHRDSNDPSEADLQVLSKQQTEEDALSDDEKRLSLLIQSETFPQSGLIANVLQRVMG
jgi:aminoglycoside phosphotransferase family enzyme